MQDWELYQTLLGLKNPWVVEGVEVKAEEKKVVVKVGYEEGTLWADEAGKRLPVHDHVARRWRHLDTCGFETVIECEVPRLKNEDGRVWTIPVPWAQKGGRYTLMFESFVIAVLLASRAITAAAELVGLGWDALHGIMQRAVERGMSARDLEGLRYLGLDEKSFRSGQDYITVMSDLRGGRVLEVVEGKDAEGGEILLETLPGPVQENIKGVAMDMSLGLEAAVQKILPGADIVHDRYHISSNLAEAVDKVRRKENKALQAEGDDTLKGTRQLWLIAPQNMSEEQAASFASIRKETLKVSRAHAIKEAFVGFWKSADEAAGRAYFKDWYGWASRSRLGPIVKVAKTLKARLENIVSYFRHRITNATAEGLNSKIQALKANARGFRNFFNYRTRILFFCGKLDLSPL